MFARVPYGDARLKVLAVESGISEGALYFHFASKREIALAVIEAQQERMIAALTRALAGGGDALEKMIRAYRGLAELVATDPVVQAGIYLENQPGSELAEEVSKPFAEWVRLARALVVEGIKDGSVREGLDPEEVAELLNALFIGAQVLSGLADQWKSLPERMKTFEPHVRVMLGPPSGE